MLVSNQLARGTSYQTRLVTRYCLLPFKVNLAERDLVDVKRGLSTSQQNQHYQGVQLNTQKNNLRDRTDGWHLILSVRVACDGSHLCCLLTVGPQTSCLIPPSFSWLSCKMDHSFTFLKSIWWCLSKGTYVKHQALISDHRQCSRSDRL